MIVDNFNVKMDVTSSGELAVTVLTSGHMGMVETTTIAYFPKEHIEKLKILVQKLEETQKY